MWKLLIQYQFQVSIVYSNQMKLKLLFWLILHLNLFKSRSYSSFGMMNPLRLNRHWNTKNFSNGKSSGGQISNKFFFGTMRTKFNTSASYSI